MELRNEVEKESWKNTDEHAVGSLFQLVACHKKQGEFWGYCENAEGKWGIGVQNLKHKLHELTYLI